MDPMTIAAAIAVMGSLFKGVTGFFSGNSAAKAAKQAGMQAQAEAGVNAQVALAEGDKMLAEGAVRTAAGGGGFTGSSMDALKHLSSLAAFKARSALYRGHTEAQGDFYQAKVLKAKALNDLIGGFYGAAGAGFSEYGRLDAASRTSIPAPTTTGGGSLDELAGLY